MSKVKSKRIVFTFDSKDLENLQKVVDLGKFQTLADAVRSSVQNMATIEEAKQSGEVTVTKKQKDGKEVQLQII